MAKISRRYDTQMGQTGAGIENAASIDMSKKNAFTTKWAEICDKCPWYFEMRNLIGQRPNLKPTGLGNSQSAVATGVILQGTVSASEAGTQQEEEEEEEEDGTSSVLLHDGADSLGDSLGPTGVKRAFLEFDDDKSDFEDDGAGLGSGDDYVPTSPAAVEADDVVLGGDEVGERDEEKEGGKTTKKAVKANAHLKNPAKPSTSNPAQPAAPAAPKASKKAKIAEFGEIALSEEQTRQKSLDLALLRTRQQMQNAQIKGRIVERREEMKWEDRKARREERMLKLRMKEAKMRHAHELRMRAGGSDVMSSTSHAAGFFDTPSSFSSRSSDYAPPDFDNFALDAFAGNAAAGPSGLQDYVGDGFSFPGPGSPSGSRQE
ncbi:hypothetical protein C8R47DRAFT_255954 [Mycena vitilis]|nr:hypothetical protein C8R47DRAFT_563568 [Mycena vitilis]KAJ6517528.1 hypothetical protein C8R47DRAFT_255954 [Mycena vitilis]